MKVRIIPLAFAVAAAFLVAAGCAQTASAPTTSATPSAKGAAPGAPAEPTRAAEPAKTTAAQPTAAPAKKVDFPEKGKYITLIIPYPAGGPSDIAARVLAPLMEKELGTSIQIVNKPGAISQVASTELVRAKPDGYTLGVVGFVAIVVTYLDPERKALYTRKDFQPIGHLMLQDQVIAVPSNSPFKTTKDLVEAGKANPEKVKVATPGIMGNSHLAGMMLQEVSGAKFAFVQFDGAGPATAALLGGHVDAAIVGGASVVPHLKSGAMRALAVVDKKESGFFPGVQSTEAQGYKVYAATSFGIIAPTGVPGEIVDLLTGAMKRSMATEELKKKFQEAGLTPAYMDPTEFEAYWMDVETRIKPLVEGYQKR